MDFGASTRRKPDTVDAIWLKLCNSHCRIVGLDIQLINGIAGNTQPNPAVT
jgi:hypothetical protein